ncbi:MAG: radical SAM protein, partial [Synergistaceae bacterium]|nr:radical SAM protein [Synergistaceae bacterium]
MKDLFGREINYMRISVTDLCNLRCRYCMPASGVQKMRHDDIMSEEEIITVIEAASELGINKIRFTGGEPLVKKNIVSICRRASRISGIDEVCLTTNGILLPPIADELRDAGVSRINISLDTLKPERYSYITRGGSLHEAMQGIDAAIKAGF